MRALRYDGKSLRLHADVPTPQPAPGEALVRVRRAAVSPTDLATARGQTRFAGTLGHEFVGVVESVDLPQDAPAPLRERAALAGKRAVASINLLCGHCEMCRAGLSPHCRNRRVLGVWDRDGCFADAVCIPAANLIPLPDEVDDDHALFAHPLSRALHAAQMIRARSAGAFITVLGSGALALLTAQTMARLNPATRLLSASPHALAHCERWGVKHRPLDEAGRRQDQDVVVDCTGTPAGVRLAMQFVRPRGTILLLPPSMPPAFTPGSPWADPATSDDAGPPPDLTPLVANEVHLVGVRDGSVSEAVALLARREIDVVSLITRRFRLDDGVDAFRAASEPEAMRIVLEIDAGPSRR